ncbi:DUF5655 domain-containing protein [Undibacterium sp. WLX3042]|uniref:DUF5655 domain-containing protein n=1 Tax=Undibacterium sp. WLX3042 TaxID=3412686 RepID=UPI003C2FCAA5
MSEINLFQLAEGKARELQHKNSGLEKSLQNLIENNLQTLLSIRFLASEYSTGKTHAGRIDTLGLDENNCPVILEYKRSLSENVINQGLFYLDWLMDHKAEFELLVHKKLGQVAAAAIDWSVPRVICIAADFTRYDAHAVQQINHQIELIRYRLFGHELLLLEQANTLASERPRHSARQSGSRNSRNLEEGGSEVEPVNSDTETELVADIAKSKSKDKSYAEWFAEMSASKQDLLSSLEDYLLSLGDDVQRKELKLYCAFKRLKNFATIVPTKNRFLLYLHLDPVQQNNLPANARDVTHIGHWGTGDLELPISSAEDFEAVKPLVQLAYEGRTV